MSDDSGQTVAIEELVEYCHTQAGLLSGRVETMREEADELLTEIDEEMAELRTRLEDHATGVEGVDGPSTPAGPGDLDLEELEELERDVEEKQLLVEAKQARMQAFQDLAANYTDLAEELQSEFDDGGTALERVIHFEADHDAPAYFESRETLVEAAAAASDESSESS
ncbi:hypothetical protein SAMN04487967_2586 [Natronorubrum sediminis]|uniref:Uncharacterized protein n=1 Tax=Natronorubrum sediminis TaxID=640943 RepID=A0A1H6G1A4_9EURY|nr:hypothetical protein [Natronorubrum sediminis]SEH16380.1 hypothetical protein SAMN04487967_2586 [Natronorubrum sediminis]